ncbi:MAG: integral rane protein MviN [Candidatus Saccharibacteria bacterium]|nr:integral rane protein MviN [Candidatus Saccharibacteria bacterium]
MKNRFFDKANKKISLGNAAALLIVAALSGQILGFLKVKLVNANFSQFGGQSTDAFFAAFKIPDFFFFTIAAGALGVAFIPVLADHLEKNDNKGAWELATSLLNMLAIVMGIVGIIILIFAEPLVHLVAPGLTPDQKHNAVVIMRLVSFNPFLFTISGILTAVQQTFGRFFFYAIAPLFYNLAVIISIFIFRDNIGIVGLGIGALIGAILQLLIVLFGLGGLDFLFKIRINFKNPDFRKVLRQLPPRSIDQGIDSINSIVETNFGSRLGAGSISYYENAYTLHTVPIQLIGTTIATAAFPRLTARLSQGRPDLFRQDFLKILRAMIWITIPMVVICFFGRGYLARLIFTRGSNEITGIFGFLCGAIFFRIIYAIISRYFYAQKDTWTPLGVSIFAIALNIFLAWQLSKPTHYGISGLALAQTIVAISEVAVLFTIMLIKDHKLFDIRFWGGLWRIFSVTGFSVVATYIMVQIFPLHKADKGLITLGFKLGIITLVTMSVHLGLSSLFSLEEAIPVVAKLRSAVRIVLKPVRIEW